jgi:DNA-binding NarL/FixJ family response regulator
MTNKHIACVNISKSLAEHLNNRAVNCSITVDHYHNLSTLMDGIVCQSYAALCINASVLQQFSQINSSNVDAAIKCLCFMNQKPPPMTYVVIDSKTDTNWLKTCVSDGYAGVLPEYDWQPSFEVDQAFDHIVDQQIHWPRKIWIWYGSVKRKTTMSGIKLTPRQLQILHLIKTRGASNKMIARQLKISESTVKVHVGAILKKYGVANRTQLAVCNTPF